MLIRWEEFEGKPTEPKGERLHVTLNKKNVFFLNRNIHTKLGRLRAVVLMFDKVNSVIGIRPIEPGKKNAFPVKKRPGGEHRVIVATPFCKHYRIKVDRTTAFIEPEIDPEGVLRLDLKSVIEIGRVKRSSHSV